MKKRRKVIIISVAIAGLIVAAYFLWFRKGSEPVVWKTTKVEKGNIAVTVTATGSVNADTTVLVGAQVSGIISKIFVDFDSIVRKGQVIALLDTTLLHAAYMDAEATVEKARAQVELQGHNFKRIDTLYKDKVASKADYDQAYATYRSSQSDLMAALANMEHAKINLHYAIIKAPINGTVISRNVDVGQTVISSFNAPTLFTIANNLKKMQVLANVDEADIGQVKVGQSVDFTVDAYPNDRFRGVVGLIRLQPVTIQNVVNYIVVIDVANPELKLLPGLTANISVSIAMHPDVLKVVSNAVHFQPTAEVMTKLNISAMVKSSMDSMKLAANEIPQPGRNCYIWVREGDTMRPELVTAGLFDGSLLEITGNIKAGDEIITGIENTASTTAAKNPFMPQMPTRRSRP
ncbi:MAG: efflux RND transporter periplasmic adaptor subunit [Bacteroidetes bacterium]|nr:efflux RND transporter periplasmic adaptor subunit [Bacteroidota bacterium]